MITIRHERPTDIPVREALLDACFGEERHMKTCERLREGRKAADGLSLTLVEHDAEKWTPLFGRTSCASYWHRSRSCVLIDSIKTHRDLMDGRLVGTIRLWSISAGPGRPALLLGPIAIDPSLQGLGLGATLMSAALERASARGHRAVLLVGDAPYYERFGFSAALTENLWLPGPYERERFLGLELTTGALAGARGLVGATGALEDKPDLATLVAASDVRRAA